MNNSSTLREKAISGTTYWIDLQDKAIVFWIGEASTEIDAVLESRGPNHWAFLTAYHPDGQPTSAQQNH